MWAGLTDDERRRELAKPELAAIFGDADEIVDLIALASHEVRPTLTPDLVRDLDDVRVLEAVIAGGANVIAPATPICSTFRSLRSPDRYSSGLRLRTRS